MKKYILMLLASASLVSCVDTVLLPDSMTVDEDYWQTKDEVNNMINGAYKSMIATNVIERLIVWGDFRSDEFVQASGPTGTIPDDLEEIQGGAIETDNTFANWASFYTVINNCNIVLSKAEGVMTLDPNYTESDYLADRSQMLSLRALCYFYLVRAYRDVPYVTEPYMNSSMDMNVTQVDPDTILQACIVDLKEAEQNAINPDDAYNDWRRIGYINKNGIDAMLADIYLWLASVYSTSDSSKAKEYYEECITYCNKVIADKYTRLEEYNNSKLDNALYPLFEYNTYFTNTYCQNTGMQNNQNLEGIFELICSTTNSNTGLCEMYNRYASSATTGYMYAPSIYGVAASTAYSGYTTEVYDGAVYDQYDMRLFNNVYNANSSNENFYPRKFVALTAQTTLTAENRVTNAIRSYSGYDQNWIVYRLPDIMLMKAEALVQLTGGNNDDSRAQQAFELVRQVNARNLYTSNKSDSLTWATCKTLDLEKLVLQERCRELSFEGKRWFDLLRYNYRHITTPTVYTMTLTEMKDNNVDFPSNTEEMMNLMTRKFTDGSDATVKAKMPTEPYLYMPIYQSEIEVNPNLKQNPVYSANEKWEKNL